MTLLKGVFMLKTKDIEDAANAASRDEEVCFVLTKKISGLFLNFATTSLNIKHSKSLTA